MNEGEEQAVVYLFGLGMILFGGLTKILEGWLFWYPFGLLTVPCTSSILQVMANRRKRNGST